MPLALAAGAARWPALSRRLFGWFVRAAVGRLSGDADARLRADRLGGRLPVGAGSPAATTASSASGRGALAPAAGVLLADAGARARPARLLLRRALYAPFGYALRGARDSALRAEAIGLRRRGCGWPPSPSPARRRGWPAALFAYSKGSVFPTYVCDRPFGRRAADGAARRRADDQRADRRRVRLYRRCTTRCCWRPRTGGWCWAAASSLLVLAFPQGIAGARAAAHGGGARRDRAGGRGPAQELSAACAAVRRRVVRGRGRRDAGADRPERRRQVDLLQHAQRPVAPRCRARAAGCGATSPACAPRRIWRLGVGRTFQITATFASMTVRENVQMALLSHRREVLALLVRRRGIATSPRPTRCSTASASAPRPTAPPACSPTAISSGWNWRWRWPTRRGCC